MNHLEAESLWEEKVMMQWKGRKLEISFFQKKKVGIQILLEIEIKMKDLKSFKSEILVISYY